MPKVGYKKVKRNAKKLLTKVYIFDNIDKLPLIKAALKQLKFLLKK